MKNVSVKSARKASAHPSKNVFWGLILVFILLLVALCVLALWPGKAENNLVGDMALVQGESLGEDDDTLTFRLNQAGDAIVQIPSSGFRADQRPLLRLRTSITDPGIRSILLWETYDGVAGQQLLTQPLLGASIHDLSGNSDWRGLIRTLGIQFSVAPDLGFRETVNDEISIHYFSITESNRFKWIPTTVSSWLDKDVVTMRTPSHVGFAENGSISPPLVLGGLVLVASVLCWWFLSIEITMTVFILCCLLLTLVELGSEMETAPYYAHSAQYHADGVHNDTDLQLKRLSEEVKDVIPVEHTKAGPKIVVYAPSGYALKRLIYHLLPQNAGEMSQEEVANNDNIKPPFYVLKWHDTETSCEQVLAKAPFAGQYQVKLDSRNYCFMELL